MNLKLSTEQGIYTREAVSHPETAAVMSETLHGVSVQQQQQQLPGGPGDDSNHFNSV